MEAEIIESDELLRDLLIAVRAPVGTTLQLPNPYTGDTSTPQHRILIKAESEYSNNIEVFVLSTGCSGAEANFNNAIYKEQSTSQLATGQGRTKQIANNRIYPTSVKKNENYWYVEQHSSVKVHVNDLYLNL